MGIDRAGGAAGAHKRRFERRQMLAVARNAARLAATVRAIARSRAALAALLRRQPAKVPIDSATIQRALARIGAKGFPRDVQNALRRSGLSANWIRGMRSQVAGLDPSRLAGTVASLVGSRSALATYRSVARSLSAYARRVRKHPVSTTA